MRFFKITIIKFQTVKIKKILFLSISILFLAAVAYFGYGVYWTYKLGVRQNTVGDNLPDRFRIEHPLQRDPNGYFLVTGKMNDREGVFILDTKATSMARTEVLNELDARHWGTYPVPVRNSYGQQEKLPLYELDSIAIGGQMLPAPLFKGISATNALHDLLYREMIGRDILKFFTWKFSLDEGKIILFSNKDTVLLKAEAQGFRRIKNGLRSAPISLGFPDTAYTGNFDFDLGYQGEISIDEDLFHLLQAGIVPKKYLNARTADRTDTTYVFNDVTIKWDTITIAHSTLCYYPLVNRNLIGAKFMSRFNFILSYRRTEDLYIQLRKDFPDRAIRPIYPDLGLDIDQLGGEPLVTFVEIGGKAEKAGVKIKDKVVEIDGGAIGLYPEKVISGETSAYLSGRQSVCLKVERDGKILKIAIN